MIALLHIQRCNSSFYRKLHILSAHKKGQFKLKSQLELYKNDHENKHRKREK